MLRIPKNSYFSLYCAKECKSLFHNVFGNELAVGLALLILLKDIPRHRVDILFTGHCIVESF